MQGRPEGRPCAGMGELAAGGLPVAPEQFGCRFDRWQPVVKVQWAALHFHHGLLEQRNIFGAFFERIQCGLRFGEVERDENFVIRTFCIDLQ